MGPVRPFALVLVAGLLVLAGCYEFDEPLCPATAKARDARLFGRWLSPSWEVHVRPGSKPTEPLVFELWQLRDGVRVHAKPGRTVGHVCTGSKGSYLNVRTAGQLRDPRTGRKSAQVYQIFRYHFTSAEELTVQAPAYQTLAAAIESKHLTGKAWDESWGNQVRVTDKGATALRWFEGTADVFGQDATVLRRPPSRKNVTSR